MEACDDLNMGGGEVGDFLFISLTYIFDLAGLSNIMLKKTVILSGLGERDLFLFVFSLILTLLRNFVTNVH